jgi:hypothetical protein
MKISYFLVGISLLVSLAAQNAFCETSGDKISLGLMLGPAFPSGSSSSLGSGAKLDYRLFPGFSLGLNYYSVKASIEMVAVDSSVSASSALTAYGFEGMWDFSPGFSAGAKLGYIRVSQDFFVSDHRTVVELQSPSNGIYLGPGLAYEATVADHVTIGGELSYLFTFSSHAPKLFNLLFVGKVSF